MRIAETTESQNRKPDPALFPALNVAFQPKKFTSYERDGNGSDEAMFRRYNRWQSRFDQPDPYDGSYNVADPQTFNRYAYVQGDPVNFIDPTGLKQCMGTTALNATQAALAAGAAVGISMIMVIQVGTS